MNIFLCFLWVFKRWQITHKLYIKRFGLYSVWDLPGFTYRLNPQIYIIYSYNYKITEELAFKSDIHVFSYYILLPISILFPQYKEGELHFRRFVCDHSIRLHRVSWIRFHNSCKWYFYCPNTNTHFGQA